MSNLLPAGRYRAKIKDYGIGTTAAGDPQMIIMFNVAVGQDLIEMTWYGSFKQGTAQEITLKALLTCGFQDNDIDALAYGAPSNLLDTETELSVVIQHEVNNKGQTVARLKWINSATPTALERRLDRGEAKTKLQALNLKGELMALRAKEGQSKAVPTPRPPAMSSPVQEQIPGGFDSFIPSMPDIRF